MNLAQCFIPIKGDQLNVNNNVYCDKQHRDFHTDLASFHRAQWSVLVSFCSQAFLTEETAAHKWEREKGRWWVMVVLRIMGHTCIRTGRIAHWHLDLVWHTLILEFCFSLLIFLIEGYEVLVFSKNCNYRFYSILSELIPVIQEDGCTKFYKAHNYYSLCFVFWQ